MSFTGFAGIPDPAEIKPQTRPEKYQVSRDAMGKKVPVDVYTANPIAREQVIKRLDVQKVDETNGEITFTKGRGTVHLKENEIKRINPAS